MSAKAYLMLHIETATCPAAIIGAEISTSPLALRTLSAHGTQRWIEVLHMRGNTYDQAEQKLMTMIQDNLRFLLPFVDPSREAYEARYELEKRIKVGLGLLPLNPQNEELTKHS